MNNRGTGFFVFIAALCMFASHLHAQGVISLEKAQGLHHVGQYAAYLEDPGATLTIGQISSREYSAKFIPTNKEQTTFGVTSSVYWVRFAIVTDDAGWCIQTEPAMSDNLQLYRKTESGWDISYNGIGYPFTTREVQASTAIFPLEQNPRDTVEYFLRIQSSFPIYIQLRAGTEKDFWISQINDNLLNGVFFGIMLLMALYNLFLYLTNRDRVYVFYALYVIFCVIFISFSTGYSVFLPEFIRKVHNFNHILYPFVFGIFGLLFSQRFLFTKRYAPRLHTVMNVFMGIVSVVFLVDFFNHQLATTLIQLMGVALTIISFTVGITVYRAGYKPARYYLLGFGIYTLGLSAYILLAVAKIDTSRISPSNIMMASSAIEAIILSFAIGDKLNAAVRDKQAAQEEKMEALRVNEQLVREQNVVLEWKVEERTKEINNQKEIIEEKNKDILDSIHYAKRIQRALLASDTLLRKNLSEYFVFYKPKDIVSGDYYWATEDGDKFWLCIGDCTGHGVPGAFMSLLNISIMRELIVDHNIQRPDHVLNTQRDAIIMSLNPDGAEEAARDGMDCALLCFDKKSGFLSFACANNPVWIVRGGKLIEFKGDKQPVGLYEGKHDPFTLCEFHLVKGDIVYALTDGFADQFGGPRGKKFKYSQLKEQVIGIHRQSMSSQLEKFDRVFEEWRGELEQVDDVLLIGIRI